MRTSAITLGRFDVAGVMVFYAASLLLTAAVLALAALSAWAGQTRRKLS